MDERHVTRVVHAYPCALALSDPVGKAASAVNPRAGVDFSLASLNRDLGRSDDSLELFASSR
jgi:hypothetical protein